MAKKLLILFPNHPKILIIFQPKVYPCVIYNLISSCPPLFFYWNISTIYILAFVLFLSHSYSFIIFLSYVTFYYYFLFAKYLGGYFFFSIWSICNWLGWYMLKILDDCNKRLKMFICISILKFINDTN